ncbi:uncharacterized protein LOC129569986 isoform X1 [Sitodiplosis mosellana]|uniref:uncharacterized protein LOC129569986 isoform X1 n=1 Tax=Sitodiplosis mosellana TaxID=263140 RepID=UPI002443BB5C|nr:uncharacterized protein LOC129569986 isoform X1 [Sitodiplosis mosellana]
MMKRPISFVLHICIITTILFYCSICTEQVKLVQTTAGINMPANTLYTASISNFGDAENERSDNISSQLDYAHRNESSQRIGDDIVYLPKSTGYYLENHNENSDTQSTVESQLHKRAVEPQDICDTNECKCKFETKFLTVDCHFQQHYTLGASKIIRPSAETLLITLSSDAEFTLDANVFTNNRLNRIMIQGSGLDSGREHVEISSNAFNGNGGPFPEIEIVNVHTVNIRSNAFYFEFKLNITNCAKVRIFSEAFANTTFHGHFENIHDFQLLERAFSKSTAKVTVNNSRLDELRRLEASLKEIKFSNTHIGTILTNTFDVIKIDSIIFENCHIDTIQSNAFTEKLFSNQLSLTGCNIGTIEAAAISGSGISDVILHNNSILSIKGKAITLTSITTLIQGNNISLTEIFWFRVEGWSTVAIENNHFGMYERMGVEITKSPIKCIFENNYITKTVADSLNFKSPHCRVRQVSFDRACSCNSTYFRQLSYNDISADSYCRIDSTLSHCFNASLYNVKSYKDAICDNSTQIDCVKNRINARPNGYFIDLDRLFNRSDKLVYVYLGIGILLIILIIFLLTLIIRRCMRSKKDIDDGPTRDIMLMESLHPMTATLTTQLYNHLGFSDPDLVIINHTLREMKRKYPPEIYDQIDNNTRKLIAGNLTETDRDILYNHLGAGCDTTQTLQINGPIYAEPGLAHLDIINSTNGGRNNQNFMGDNGGFDGEHIYAEPINLQQPLLRNDYNVPIDVDSASHMYTEPVTGAIDYISSPRPVVNSKNFDPSHLYALPSKSAMRSNPATSLQRSAEASTSSSFLTNRNNLPKISCLGEKFKNSAHSSSQESNNSHSDHSGASGVTLPLDEPIEYADA